MQQWPLWRTGGWTFWTPRYFLRVGTAEMMRHTKHIAFALPACKCQYCLCWCDSLTSTLP